MSKILHVAVREFLATVMTKAFIIGGFVIPGLVMAIMVIVFPRLLNEKPPEVVGTLAVIDHSGRVTAHAVKAAQPDRSADFTFIAEGRDNWGLGFLRSVDRVPGKRSPGSLSWGGLNNTYFWIDPKEQLYVVFMMQSPAARLPYRFLLRQMVYQALVR